MRSASSGVGAELVADLLESGRELGRARGEALLGAGGAGVDHRAVGEHQRHRADGPVGVGDDAAAHAAGVVGDHAADAGDVRAGRVRAEPAAVAGEQPVGEAERHAGLQPRDAHRAPATRARCQWWRTSTRIESVCDWPLRLVPPARNTTGVPVLARRSAAARATSAASRGRTTAWGSAGRGWRRTRSGRGQWRGSAPGRRRAPRSGARAAAPASPARPSRARGRRPAAGWWGRASAITRATCPRPPGPEPGAARPRPRSPRAAPRSAPRDRRRRGRARRSRGRRRRRRARAGRARERR